MNVSSYTSKASSSSGFSGMASGLDTESLVEQMLAGTQSKIDKQEGLKQQVKWKQDIYRDIISQLNSFQNKFFSKSGSSSLLSSSFYNLMNATTTSKAFKVTATSSAAVGSTKVKVEQLATNTKLTSGSAVSGTMAGSIDTAALQAMVDKQLTGDRELVLSVGGQDVAVDLKDVYVTGGNLSTYSDADKADMIAQKINDAMTGAGVTTVSAAVKDGQLTITSTDTSKVVKVSADSDQLALDALGLTAGKGAVTSGEKATLTSKINYNSEFRLDVSLDDSKKTVRIDMRDFVDGSGNVNIGDFRTALTGELNRVHGTNQIQLGGTGNTLEFVVSAGRKVSVSGNSEALNALGFKSGQSNKIGMGGNLKDLSFGTDLQGGSFKFSINGVSFSFTENHNMTEIMNRINASDAGVRVVYKPLEDKFIMESTNSGEGFGINMTQEEGNLLNVMFGAGDGTLTSGSKVGSGTLVTNSMSATQVLADSDFSIESGNFKLTVDGKAYTINLPKQANNYTKSDVITEIDNQLNSLFDGGIRMNTDGSLSITNGAKVSFDKSAVSDPSDPEAVKKAAQKDLALAFGFGTDGMDNVATASTTLGELGLNLSGYSAGDTLGSLSGNLSFEDGRIVVSDTGAGITIGDSATMQTLFGRDSLDLGVAAGTAAEYKAGENAVVYIDGVRTERSSNSFNINGMSFELKGVSTDEEEIEVSRGTDQIVDGIKAFVEEYNSLIDKLNKLVREDSTYKSYAPLTSEQKKEMSEREIELWEEKAKSGLLRRDSTVESLLTSMRSVLYSRPEGSAIGIYDLGIETSSNWQDYGKLTISSDGEAKLRQMIESDPDAVVKLFTDENSGIATKMESTLKAAANTSTASPGSLVRIAGMTGRVTDTDNELYRRMKEIDNRIATLKRTYEKEKTRYWRQFNSMEQIVSNMTSQSNWLTQQLGG